MSGIIYSIGPDFRAHFAMKNCDGYVTWTWDAWTNYVGIKASPRQFVDARQAVQARDMTKFMEVVE